MTNRKGLTDRQAEISKQSEKQTETGRLTKKTYKTDRLKADRNILKDRLTDRQADRQKKT